MQQRASVLLCGVLTLGGSAAPVPVAGGPVPAPRVTGFTLLDATTDQPIPGFEPIANGSVLDLAVLPTRALNIRANVDGVTGSVRFDDGKRVGVRTEDLPPYALAGDDRGDYEAWNPALREHVLTATPFAQTGGRGAAGTAASVTFRVTSGNGAGAHDATRATPSAGPGPAPDVPSTSVGRIAVTADGNQHDKDDWGASPLGLAILAQRGLQANVVHYDYNSHGWDSAEGWAQEKPDRRARGRPALRVRHCPVLRRHGREPVDRRHAEPDGGDRQVDRR